MFMTKLSPVAQKFVLHWGEMGTRWGINRTVAQVHALLFLSERPLPADEIAETLAIARSNTSTSLRELQNWGIVKIVHVLRDCIAEAGKPKSADAYTRSQLSNLLEFFELAGAAYERLEGLPTPAVLRLAKLGDKALRMVGIPK